MSEKTASLAVAAAFGAFPPAAASLEEVGPAAEEERHARTDWTGSSGPDDTSINLCCSAIICFLRARSTSSCRTVDNDTDDPSLTPVYIYIYIYMVVGSTVHLEKKRVKNKNGNGKEEEWGEVKMGLQEHPLPELIYGN